MKEKDAPTMTTLDQMVNDDSIQMMKAVIPYVSVNERKTLSLMAKFMELRRTMVMFDHMQTDMMMMSSEEAAATPEEMLRDIQQYTRGSLHDSIDNMLNMLQTVQIFMLYQDMEEE